MARLLAMTWLGIFLLGTVEPALASPRGAQWKQVKEAVQKGLPRTAIQHLERIITTAMAEKAYPEAIKAIGQKTALEANIQGFKPEEKITRLQAEINRAPRKSLPCWRPSWLTGTGSISRTAAGASCSGRKLGKRPARISPPGTCRASWPRSTDISPRPWLPKPG